MVKPFTEDEERVIRFWQRHDRMSMFKALRALQRLPRRQRLVQEAYERNRRKGP